MNESWHDALTAPRCRGSRMTGCRFLRTIVRRVVRKLPASTEHLTDEQVNEFKEAFKLFDKDGNGDISVQELGQVMKSLGQNPSEEELKKMIAEVDTDGSGSIEFPEFMQLMSKKMKETDTEGEIKEAFLVFDDQAEGVISAHYLREIMTTMGDEPLSEEDTEEMLKAASPNSDGEIDYEAFIRRMTS